MEYQLDMSMMFAMHDALRRELVQVARIGRRTGDHPGQLLRAALGRELFKKFLLVHHQSEDDTVRRRNSRALRVVPAGHDVPGRAGQNQGARRLRRDGRARLGGGPAARRRADRVPELALGAVHQRPIAVLVLIGTGVLVPGDTERGTLDVPGAIAATLGVGSVIFALTRGNTNGWNDPGTLVSFAAGAVLLAAFGLIERRSRAPMVPPRLAYLPFVVGVGVASGGLGPRLIGALPARIVIAAGMLLCAGVLAWYVARLTPASDYVAVMLPAMLTGGTGTGLTFVGCTVTGMRDARISPAEAAAR